MKLEKNILFIHAPFKNFAFDTEWQKTDSLAPPLGLMYLIPPLIEKGFEVNFIDLNIEKFTENAFANLISHYSFIGISCYSDSLANVKKIITFIRQVHKEAYILCGGPYCNLTENFLEGADLVAIGEAESYIVEILTRLRKEESLQGIQGLVYKKNNQIIRNPGRMKTIDLNKSRNASVVWAKKKDYGHFFGMEVKNIIGIMSSRGCPFDCSFCTHRGIFEYRERSLKSVIEEIRNLNNSGYRYIIFYDDNFLANKKRVIEIMNAIIQDHIAVKMIVQGRVDSSEESFYKKLKEAGVIMIMFGIESANQDILDFYNKRISLPTIEKAISLTNKAGILSFGYFIIGAPFESEEHLQNNLRLMNQQAIDFININILGYYQGAKLWEDAVNKGLISRNETIVWANKDLSRYDYQGWVAKKKELLHDFYFNPFRIARIVSKLIRQRDFFILSRLIMLNKNFLSFIYNPFAPKDKRNAKIFSN